LLVVTDWDLNILNSKFRDQLMGRVGPGYQPELRLITNQDKKAPVVISGGNTPYWAIIHLPARNIRPGEELFSYQRVITKWLEAGIRSAVTEGSRRRLRQRKPNFKTEWERNSEEGWIKTEKGAVSLTKRTVRPADTDHRFYRSPRNHLGFLTR